MAKKKVKLAASGANTGVQVLAANDEPLKASISGVNFRVGNFSSTNSPLLFSGNRSIEFMFSIDSIPSNNITVFKDSLQGYPRSGVFVSKNNNNLYVTLGGKIVIIPGNIKINHPYHIVLTIDPGNQEGKVYVDNVLIGSNTDFTADQEPDNLFIGVLESPNTSLVTVSLCRLFNYILTTNDISELWNDGDPKSYVLPDSGLLNTGCVAEYLPKNIEDKVWVESGGSSSLNLSGTGDFDFTYKVGDVDGYQRFSIPWDPSAAGDNLYIFMNPDMHSQVCLIGSDENTISKTRQKTLTFQTTPLTGVVQGAQSIAELEVTQEEAVYTYEFRIASSVTGKLSAGGQNTALSASLVTFRNGVQVSTQSVNASYSIPATPGFTLSGSTLTAANRTTVVGGDRSVEVTGEFTTSEGIKVTDVISVTQAENIVSIESAQAVLWWTAGTPGSATGFTSYYMPRVTFQYSSGSTNTQEVSDYERNGNRPSGGLNIKLTWTTHADSGISYGWDKAAGHNKSGWQIEYPARGTTVGASRGARVDLTVSTYDGGHGEASYSAPTVTQEANVETLNGLLITAPNKDNVPYTGGTITWTANGTYKYTSGSTQTKSVAASAGTWSVTGAGATQSSNTTTWAQNLSEGSRTATVKFVVSGVTGTGTTTQLSQDLVVASYTNVVSTYSNSKAGYKK